MKLKGSVALAGFLALILAILFFSAAYTVDMAEQVIITRFGKPVGDAIIDPGLHFKTPFVEDVHRFEKRVMEWDSDHREIPTNDKKFIKVDATARWRIKNPLEYFKRIGNEFNAQSRLNDIVGGATKDVITSLDLIESVRSTNREFSMMEETFEGQNDMGDYKTEVGRHKISKRIQERAKPSLEEYGIELIDVRLRRINYVESVRSEVYQRMISERNRMAEFYRSEGAGKQMEIEGEREKELKIISSEAYRQAEEIRGQADAEAVRIYAEAFGQDPEFYSFLKTLETYESTIDQGTDLILTTNSDFFKYLKSIGEEK
ncbi:MAG: protease modulator HflC [Planctomycetota bacterium]